jgi:membrane associated rhomboid family serine protease
MPPSTSRQITLALPAFTGLVKRLVLANVIVYFGMLVLGLVSPHLVAEFYGLFALSPHLVVHNFAVWQLISYGFIHGGLLLILFNMLMLWFIGAQLESDFGPRWLGEVYFFSLVGAGLCTVALVYFPLLHLDPQGLVSGSSGALFGLLVAYAVFYADQEMYLFFVLRMKVKYLVALFLLLSVAGLISSSNNAAYAAQLGGALFGYMYAKFAPRRGFGFGLGESYYGLRNAWYRRKRRKAAKKFEVYMGKHDHPSRVPDPDTKRDPNDRRWMN